MTNQTLTRKARHRRAPILYLIVLAVLIVFTFQRAVASRSQGLDEPLYQGELSKDAADKNKAPDDTDGKANEDWTVITTSEEDITRGNLILVSNRVPYGFSDKL